MKRFYNQSLKEYNTFRIDVVAHQFIDIEKSEEIDFLFQHHIFDAKFLLMGGGSNLLFTKDFEGTIVRLALKGIEITNETEDAICLKVAAGELWEDFINYCIDHQYYGIENLIGIPGWVGSAPVQNIGAYGVEVKDVIEKVEGFYIKEETPFTLYNSQCAFAYRDSIFKRQLKNQCLITYVHFKLSKKEFYTLSYKALRQAVESSAETPSLSLISQHVLRIRNSKLPDVNLIGSAGSFFKNPTISKDKLDELLLKASHLTFYEVGEGRVKLSAAQLIDLCGCKSWRSGDISVYPHQPLVLVNYGSATGKELFQFSEQIAQKVQEQFDIELEREVNVIF